MKKFFYVIILAAVASLSIVSCTEQEIKPKTTTGGAVSDPTGPKG